MSRFRTTMWETVAEADTLAQLLCWVAEVAEPDLIAADPGCSVQIYQSEDNRVVVIASGTAEAPTLPDPPSALCRRLPHQWQFESIR